MKVLGFAGWSGSGKTTLMIRLLPELIGRGVSVSTIKHSHHGFRIDRPGKDSYEHRAAGAQEVVIGSRERWALIRELRGAPEVGLGGLIAKLAPVDLVLVEGFTDAGHDKIEVVRAAAKPSLHPSDPSVVAIAAGTPLPDASRPVLDLDDIPAIADFVIAHCRLGAR
ncbi:MAG: molybdopterin-guanine dinucleotide biosynthesis protein B [Alphaproteobacteria bacterium]|jgi:molybdopterin-guanine dinucleotide biosynthesis protein B|nr:molybdopterin-guanine dinucleotide biosynthesis protein B [Alphaproteobacteria bacterium]MDP6515591.1 molybdopterin-guanine dinucleotide biosynthesis protein B [Alphaproteobacteria bacterium]